MGTQEVVKTIPSARILDFKEGFEKENPLSEGDTSLENFANVIASWVCHEVRQGWKNIASDTSKRVKYGTDNIN